MDRIIDWPGGTIEVDATSVARLLPTIGIAVALRMLRSAWLAIVNQWADDPQSRCRRHNAAWYTVTVARILLIGRVWLEGVQTLATSLGPISVGIAIALRDPIVDRFDWIFIG